MAAVRTDRQGVRVLLTTGQDLVEGPGKRFVETLLAAIQAKDYATYRNQSAGNLLEAVAQQPAMTDLVTGLDRASRAARAHEEFRLVGTDVELLNRGVVVERLQLPILADRALAGVETINALGLGILCAAVDGGLDVEAIAPLTSEDIGLEAVISTILAGSGWRGFPCDWRTSRSKSAARPTSAAGLC